jgi:trans-aconitate methyltransferase
MLKYDFSVICDKYSDFAVLQRSAGETLIDLLKIRENEDVLDLGCGSGDLTRIIRKITNGKVVGIDASEGMIKEAIRRSEGLDILFEVKKAEDVDYEDAFDVIFSNSVFHWFENPEIVLRNCYKALRNKGRIGVQTIAKKNYCPNFIKALENVKNDHRTKYIFKNFIGSWFLLDTEEEYNKLFQKCGFNVKFSEIREIKTKHTPEEVFNIFCSGSVIFYLNPSSYSVPITKDYVYSFREIIMNSFIEQADTDGKVELVFNRLFLIATKP